MLVRALKPNFEGFYAAAKQLLVWTSSNKREFSTSYICADYFSLNGNERYNRRNESFNESADEFDFDDDEYKRQRGKGYNNVWERNDWTKNNIFSRHKWKSRKFEVNFKGNKKPLDGELVPLKKDFYEPHPDVVNRTEEEIKEFHRKHNITVFGEKSAECPPPIFNFNELNLPGPALEVIRNLNYSQPTPIQSMTWPVVLSGYDMVGISQTGSGKTLGFALPALIHIQHQVPVRKYEGPIALIIAPTRELVQQVMGVIHPFAKKLSLRTACFFGGESKAKQIFHLKSGVDICVATPGRLIDILEGDFINLNRCTYCVFDEADRLLDMGFQPQIDNILEQSRPDKQVLMWSATWPKEVQNLAANYLRNSIAVQFGSTDLCANPNITQLVRVCDQREKKILFMEIMDEIMNKDPKNCKTLIFAKTKSQVEEIGYFLNKQGYNCGTIHSDKNQANRNRILESFRLGRTKILVGTLVVGRGLDITDIQYVINYDFPTSVEDYVHIIGRTGRNNNLGTSYTLFTYEDVDHADELIKILRGANQNIDEKLLRMRNGRFPKRKRW